VSFWQILKDAAVAKICDVEEDIVANWLQVVLIPVFGCLATLFLTPPSGGSVEDEDVEDELELEEEVGEVEYNLFTLCSGLLS